MLIRETEDSIDVLADEFGRIAESGDGVRDGSEDLVRVEARTRSWGEKGAEEGLCGENGCEGEDEDDG